MHRILPRFTVTTLQASAYLLGVALFSISFLVFLNSSISFVVTDVIGQTKDVGDAVGTLGFADELLALVACPLWGLISDRLGVRMVSVIGYCIIALSLICLVQAKQVYPDLLIFRLLFSIGGAACSTMVTAILPTMTLEHSKSSPSETPATEDDERTSAYTRGNRRSMALSVSSELTVTPARYESQPRSPSHRRRSKHGASTLPDAREDPKSDTSQLAGFVGMFTGIGALVALFLFLPLPAVLGENDSKVQAVQESFYIVAAVAVVVAALLFFGLRNLPGEENKGFRTLFSYSYADKLKDDGPYGSDSHSSSSPAPTYLQLVRSAVMLGFTDPHIALGYLGGFVARASSVGISLFIPLFVKAYFIREGLCTDDPNEPIKQSCKDAYKLASMLTGISQLVALLAAPLFGYFNARVARTAFLSNLPLGIGAIAGIIGCIGFGLVSSPDPKSDDGSGKFAILAVIPIGLGQIGAIVCSLGLLSRGIQKSTLTPTNLKLSGNGHEDSQPPPPLEAEIAPLLPSANETSSQLMTTDRTHLKGSIAGVYSLAGGAGILILTKLGGLLFDKSATGAPFFLLAGFNSTLLVAIVIITIATDITKTVDEGHEIVEEDEEEEEVNHSEAQPV